MGTALYILIIFGAMFIQAITGFGGPLIAMPLAIVAVGVTTAKPAVTIAAFLSGLLVAIEQRKNIDKKQLIIMTGVMLIGVALGLWAFKKVSMDFLLTAYAIIVFSIGVKKMFFPGKKALPKPVQYSTLGIAGLMQGLFISGGSFLVIYAEEHLKDKQQFRGTLSAVWTLLNTFILTTYLFTDTYTAQSLKLAAYTVIPLIIAVYLGAVVAKKLKKETFLKLTYIILIASGIILFINSIT